MRQLVVWLCLALLLAIANAQNDSVDAEVEAYKRHSNRYHPRHENNYDHGYKGGSDGMNNYDHDYKGGSDGKNNYDHDYKGGSEGKPRRLKHIRLEWDVVSIFSDPSDTDYDYYFYCNTDDVVRAEASGEGDRAHTLARTRLNGRGRINQNKGRKRPQSTSEAISPSQSAIDPSLPDLDLFIASMQLERTACGTLEGDLMLQGYDDGLPNGAQFAITGGFGDYVGATGYVRFAPAKFADQTTSGIYASGSVDIFVQTTPYLAGSDY